MDPHRGAGGSQAGSEHLVKQPAGWRRCWMGRSAPRSLDAPVAAVGLVQAPVQAELGWVGDLVPLGLRLRISHKGTNGRGYVPRTHPFLSRRRLLPVSNSAAQIILWQEGESWGGCRRSRAGRPPGDWMAGTVGSEWPELGLWAARDRNVTPTGFSTRRELMGPHDGRCRGGAGLRDVFGLQLSPLFFFFLN